MSLNESERTVRIAPKRLDGFEAIADVMLGTSLDAFVDRAAYDEAASVFVDFRRVMHELCFLGPVFRGEMRAVYEPQLIACLGELDRLGCAVYGASHERTLFASAERTARHRPIQLKAAQIFLVRRSEAPAYIEFGCCMSMDALDHATHHLDGMGGI